MQTVVLATTERWREIIEFYLAEGLESHTTPLATSTSRSNQETLPGCASLTTTAPAWSIGRQIFRMFRLALIARLKEGP